MNDEFVCAECFNDQGMKDFCNAYAEENECSFCGTKNKEPIAAPLDDVISHINACIHHHFDDPANAGLPFESAEGGYQGSTYYTSEVFDELGLDFPQDRDGRLYNAISAGVDNDLWSEAEPFRLSSDQRLQFSWENFCRIIKHELRFFFLRPQRNRSLYDDEDELFSPERILHTIFKFAESANGFVTLPAGTKLFRARYQPKDASYFSASTLGPPPVDHAIKTNRMSPPGVVMTYAAEDKETALAETADSPGTFVVAEFANDRDLMILDLTRIPEVPSFFAELSDTMEYDPRPRLNFLHNISREISRPIARDDRVHVEYVPTQVVTEYVRTAIEINGQKVDGIRYNSSRRHAATAIVLFADQENLVLDEGERPEFYRTADRWLRLVKFSTTKVTAKNITRWTTPPRTDLFK
ncbi:HEPN-associated N-terminal domain-containing protein [Afipia clevelandensis]|uniref:RES domain-containing protein n=1 Tax=Afipia clevelandensis ATCC 49720 TaxID=883079 RepID=K8P635_9BRAD|nr:HEPN-associated N-terminal domain-containing protein [Afipia clevelandensis]EKS33888.1 hypothetical protein HMPREF9696_03008 [Afipia clevelandensis ATCC 49720]